MASTYSTSLKLELIGTGDQSGSWGTTTNKNLGTLLEQAIVGQSTIVMANADYTLSDIDGTSDQARNAAIIITGVQSATYNVICPAVPKVYIITNNLGSSATAYFKPSGGTALSIANGNTVLAYCTGTVMVPINYVSAAGSATTATTATNIAGGVASQIPYQTGAGATSFIPNGTADQVFKSNGTSIPTWVNQSTLSVGSAVNATNTTNIAGGSANVIPYQTATGTTSFLPAGTAGYVLTSNGSGSAPSWATGGTAGSLVTTNYSITEVGGNLVFKYGATTIASMDSSGNLITLGSNTAGGTP
jgi:hypothetical protein